MIIDTYGDEHLRLETQQIWGYERKMHFIFYKKKILSEKINKKKRKENQGKISVWSIA